MTIAGFKPHRGSAINGVFAAVVVVFLAAGVATRIVADSARLVVCEVLASCLLAAILASGLPTDLARDSPLT